VATASVKSFRLVAANPISVTQGLADAWCQVIGRIPIEIVSVEVDDQGDLVVIAFDGERESRGSARVGLGWVEALATAVGGVLGDGTSHLKQAAS
jgi:hypothetical protein